MQNQKQGRYQSNIQAINVSPIIVDMTPEDVQKRSVKHSKLYECNSRQDRNQPTTGISDFNPLELIDSTDKFGREGESLRTSKQQTRSSKSCMSSPRDKELLDRQFRRDVDKYLQGYSVIYPEWDSQDQVSNTEQKNLKCLDVYSDDADEYRKSQGGILRKRYPSKLPQTPTQRTVETQINFTHALKNGIAQDYVRKSKSNLQSPINKPPPIPQTPQSILPQGKLQGSSKAMMNFKKVGSLYQLNKLKSVYQRQRKQKKLSLNTCLKSPAPFQSKKKQYVKTEEDRGTLSSQSRRSTSRSQSHLKKKSALTTGGGYKTSSQGTETSGGPSSPAAQTNKKERNKMNATKYQEFAQTAYTFEMLNALRNAHAQKPYPDFTNLDQNFPMMQANFPSTFHTTKKSSLLAPPSITPSKPSLSSKINEIISLNQKKNKGNQLDFLSGLKAVKKENSKATMHKEFLPKLVLKHEQITCDALQKEIDKFKVKIMNSKLQTQILKEARTLRK